MLRDKRVVVLVFITLLGVMAYRLYDWLGPESTGPRPPGRERDYLSESLEKALAGIRKRGDQKRAQPYYQSRRARLRNPFLFPEEREEGPQEEIEETVEPALELKAIVKAGSHYLALVDSHIIREGDRVAGYQVDRVTEKEVVLRREESRWILKLPSPGPGKLRISVLEG